ncbi:Uu.00g126500.m01.CDS01 [Anthostomella pinea]|uniref:Uu.00g126500.m01.CDS01 n=1 Tax=Anthostomella pinea TaxID=933095 RepID=A0AAI8VIJ1_9PEZI|nr:Uu.00g126500.m01.CDS01 [Anthostomella pinea]
MTFLATQFDGSRDLVDISDWPNDWGRFNSTGYLAAAQMLAYRTLVTGATLAEWVGDNTGLNTTWLNAAAGLNESVNAKLWDPDFGAFKDNYGDYANGLYAQDGNSLAVLFDVVNASSEQAQDISSWLTQNWTPIGAESPELPGEISPFISSFEIQAHLVAGQAERALELIRSSWGFYLANENGTQSTMIEGYLTDGTFGYRHDAGYEENYSYTSHAYGWSTGPVTALTEHIVGLSVTGMAGSTWRLAPQFGGLTHVEGGFTTSLGKFSANWTVQSDGSYVIIYETPLGTTGEVLLSGLEHGNAVKVVVDGRVAKRSLVDVVQGSGGRQLFALRGEGGKHRVEVG